ncbi:MAG TPA: KpsF/GutQ family sugar-phosphate isomerase [Candidatus Polarisedimenticolia bacterium]|jgi:arabinose-5-phosphate isomerase|nr:KpsF/GutQ family sugar-phosphate isomerase [Candidatus Polarisedimenticolia bacterium]
MPHEIARRVLELEARAILNLVPRLGESFGRAVDLLHACKGRVVVTGMGKSGLIGTKIAATFSSTGTPSLFLHPAEAVHGDIGMVVPGDVVLAISQSGETAELLRLLELIKRLDVGLISLTGDPESTLARHSRVVLDVRIDEEASPLGLVPTASTTAALALGDALAMALLEKRGFTLDEFARYHPGGRIGKKVVTVAHLMHKGTEAPLVRVGSPMRDAIRTMSDRKLGMTCVVREDGTLAGVITDGDLRRHLGQGDNLLATTVDRVMTSDPATIPAQELAAAALRVMETRKITSLVVVDDARRVLGVLHIHDLWRTQLF